MSIRLRLTLVFSSILAFTLIVFSIVLFAIQSQFTLNLIESDLRRAAIPIVNRFSFSLSDPGRMPPETDNGEPKTQPLSGDLLINESKTRMRDFVQILDVEGNPINSPFNQGAINHSINGEGLRVLNNGASWIEIITDEEERLLVYNQPAVDNDETIAIIQVARSLADRDRSMQALGITLLVGSALTTLVAFGGGWFLAGTTLRPVTEMTQTAHSIGQARDFSARVQYDGPEDEIGHLATTFNEMLSQLQVGYQQVTHSLQVQRDFVADVSHELRTPLTTVRGNLDLLKRDPPLPQKERIDILDDLTSESERLSRLVNDLLILAHADAGRTLPCEKVDVKSVTEDALRQMRLLAPGCEILSNGSESVLAHANEDALKQVMLILLDNAIKHAVCPIYVDITQSKDDISIRIQDSGPGMSKDQLSRIFDRFYRGGESRSSPGFGLGLSIARTLIQAQQGDIKVKSEVGKGSTFIITLHKHTTEEEYFGNIII